MQIDLPYCDLTMSENVEELRLQLNDYLYRLRETIETAIEMELTTLQISGGGVSERQLNLMRDQIISDTSSLIRNAVEIIPNEINANVNYETGMITFELVKGE